MNKNIIALAVAAAMAAPLAAQADVTVSGQLQAEIVSLSGDGALEGIYIGDGAEAAKINSGNAGFLAFTASEDLGNGMKALAKYNFNVRADDASQGTRDAYVGLTGGFGTVLAGRMSSPYKSSTVKWDPFLATFAQARGSNGMSGYHNSYVSNALAYANKFGPVKVVAAVVFDEAADDEDTTKTSADHAKSLSLNIPVGPVELAVGYLDMTDFGTNPETTSPGPDLILGNADDVVTPASETGDLTAVKAGVKYAAGAITAAFQYETIDTGLTDNTNFMYVTGSYAMGANTFSASYGNVDNGTQTDGYMAVGMKHAFSKSTSVHVAYRVSDDDSAADADVNAVGAGLRVKF